MCLLLFFSSLVGLVWFFFAVFLYSCVILTILLRLVFLLMISFRFETAAAANFFYTINDMYVCACVCVCVCVCDTTHCVFMFCRATRWRKWMWDFLSVFVFVLYVMWNSLFIFILFDFFFVRIYEFTTYNNDIYKIYNSTRCRESLAYHRIFFLCAFFLVLWYRIS